MPPLSIGIGADRSGAGKTLVACRLLERLSGWGAIKFTGTSLYSAVLDSPEALNVPGKDTARMLEAGAQCVLWVQSTAADAAETVGIALNRLSSLEGIIIEGNSAVRAFGRPDVVIFIASGATEGVKDNVDDLLQNADVIIYASEPPPARPPGAARAFRLDDARGYVEYVLGVINGKKGADQGEA